MEVSIPGHGKGYVHILAASEFNAKLNVSRLDTAVHNIIQDGYHLAEPSLANDGKQVPILGLAGVDLIQSFPEFALTSCMFGAAFSTSLGSIPFGNISNFLNPGQEISIEQLQTKAERADEIILCITPFLMKKCYSHLLTLLCFQLSPILFFL